MERSHDEPHGREWAAVPADDVGETLVAAMTSGGVDHVFFTSGSEIAFYQEAIAKAQVFGRPAPKLITMTHEHACLNAAIGYSMASGKPSVTAVHVDAGTLQYGGAIHTAWHCRAPVLMTAGAPAASPPGSMRGSRHGGAHIWQQQTFDQNGIVRPYVKWDHRLEYQDNPGLVASRALQVALTEPRGPVYLSVPREISLLQEQATAFPTVDQLGIPLPPGPDPDGIREIADRLLSAENPVIIVSELGRRREAVPELVALAELLGIPVIDGASCDHHSFPMNHPLYVRGLPLDQMDVVLVLEALVPWMPGANEPRPDAYVASIGIAPIYPHIPMVEFTADRRLTSDCTLALKALRHEVESRLSPRQREASAERAQRWRVVTAERAAERQRDALARADKSPIDPLWLSYQIGQAIDDSSILLDETTQGPRLRDYLHLDRPGSYFPKPGSSGGWSPGAALGMKLAEPDRDVIAVTGDGFYLFSTANAALWAAAHYGAPFMVVVYQNRSYSTGTTSVASTYPDSYAARAGFEGGVFDPPIDFVREAEACGAAGELVRDAAEIGPALQRGRASLRAGTSYVLVVEVTPLY